MLSNGKRKLYSGIPLSFHRGRQLRLNPGRARESFRIGHSNYRKTKRQTPLNDQSTFRWRKNLNRNCTSIRHIPYKPAPFCIFDEVDAPLDDTNIDKFNRIIRKFSEESQFILVTHNKRTMETTDVIYGVTMVEQGISRVVPVDLRHLV